MNLSADMQFPPIQFTDTKFPVYSYRPNYPVDTIMRTLAFDSKEKFEEWITPFSVTFVDKTNRFIDCKTSATSAFPLMA